MAKSKHKIIGSAAELQFDFQLPMTTKEEKSLAWGSGIVSVLGEDLWFSEDESGNRSPISWSWVDLLEFLGRSWASLLLEEVYPIDVNPVNPKHLRRALATRWENFVKEVIYEEDEIIYRFKSRHDLARGMKGIHLPSIFMLRQGEHAWLCTETDCKLVSLKGLLNVLEEVGNYLASLLQESEYNRSQIAYKSWNDRSRKVAQSFFKYRSGLSIDVVNQLQGEAPPEVFWEINSADNYADSEILATARMSASVTGVEVQAKILAKLKSIGKQETKVLDDLTSQCGKDLTFDELLPYESGYLLARWLRQKLKIPASSSINPIKILEQWNVPIFTVELDECRIDAIACWGDNHGPAIILNKGTGSRAIYSHGERSTLAHEMSHLLVDRGKVLPAAEVLGGLTPKYIEQKANAFAAELLIPQECVERYLTEHTDVKSAVNAMVSDFDVSAQVIGWQVKNSGLHLEMVEKSYVNQITSDLESA